MSSAYRLVSRRVIGARKGYIVIPLTSIAMETTISFALKETSGLYFISRFLVNSRSLTIFKKYQLSPASTIKMSTFDTGSQYLLIFTRL